MNDETRRWMTVGYTPDELASLLKQIAEAEEQPTVGSKFQRFLII
jgi:hypothetical protein